MNKIMINAQRTINFAEKQILPGSEIRAILEFEDAYLVTWDLISNVSKLSSKSVAMLPKSELMTPAKYFKEQRDSISSLITNTDQMLADVNAKESLITSKQLALDKQK